MSTPTFSEFDPTIIPWQYESIKHAHYFNYESGILETFSSGSIGSAKTAKDVHQIVKHCLENPGARYLMVRRALKDLKRTSWAEVIQHVADIPHFIDHYNKSEMRIKFTNGSEIIGDSYDNGDLEKFRSLLLSGADFEEINECPREVYEAIKMRVGRIPKVRQNIITSRCNPAEPDHWLYKYFIQDTDHPNKKVYYSLTEQNPFLPKWYIENLRRDLDPMMAKRMLEGKWISIRGETIYYAYKPKHQYHGSLEYKINPAYPIDLMCDFNIGQGKPMSYAMGQYVRGVFHIFAEFVMDGFNTSKIMDEVVNSGILDGPVNIIRVFGDSNGYNKDTRGNLTDYDIIRKSLETYVRKDQMYLNVEMHVPKANPSVRARQNMVNSVCTNDLGEHRLFIYKGCETCDEGLRLTKLKKGSQYLEDDSDRFQHVTTAIGYWVYRIKKYLDNGTRTRGIIFE